MPRTVAPPPIDPRQWRRLLAAVHPDRTGGDGGRILDTIGEKVEGFDDLLGEFSCSTTCRTRTRRTPASPPWQAIRRAKKRFLRPNNNGGRG
jgi:hypothetical protein